MRMGWLVAIHEQFILIEWSKCVANLDGVHSWHSGPASINGPTFAIQPFHTVYAVPVVMRYQSTVYDILSLLPDQRQQLNINYMPPHAQGVPLSFSCAAERRWRTRGALIRISGGI